MRFRPKKKGLSIQWKVFESSSFRQDQKFSAVDIDVCLDQSSFQLQKGARQDLSNQSFETKVTFKYCRFLSNLSWKKMCQSSGFHCRDASCTVFVPLSMKCRIKGTEKSHNIWSKE